MSKQFVIMSKNKILNTDKSITLPGSVSVSNFKGTCQVRNFFRKKKIFYK